MAENDKPIFLISGEDPIVLWRKPYDNEELLQKLLADYPQVIAGVTTEGGKPEELLLIRREMRIPIAEDGANRFSLDHLFIDRQSVPVLVEVKRSSDTRIRREVMGQLLDYAANAVSYWPVSKLRSSLEDELGKAGGDGDADSAVSEFTGGGDVEEFWKNVETNLKTGKIRMLIVSDDLPEELVRVIEFLNGQMNPAEILGVEVPQYLWGEGGVQILVPNIVGATRQAMGVKQPGTVWSRESFLEEAEQRSGAAVAAVFDRLFDHVESHGGRLSWGKGVTPGVAGWYPVAGEQHAVWNASTGSAGTASHPSLGFYFSDLRRYAPATFGKFVEGLIRIERYRASMERARDLQFTGKGSAPSLGVDELASSESDVNAVMAAIEMLVDVPVER